MVELFRENDILGAAVRGGVRRHRDRRADAARRDRGDLEGLRDDRAHPRRAGARRAGDQARRHRRAEGAWLPRLAAGEWLAAYALTEPGSGSDSAAMRTTARREGDEYVLDGGKRFITNAGVAGVYTVFAKTDPEAGHKGISASSSRRTHPGSRSGGSSRRWGSRARRPASCSSTTAASRPRTSSARRAKGFRLAMRVLDRSRPGIAAQGLGIAQGATDYALEYAKARETMGKPIAAAPADRGQARRHGNGVRGGARAALPLRPA